MDWKFWLPLAVNIVIGIIAYQQLRLMKTQIQEPGIIRSSNWALYWPVFVCLLLMVGTWIPYYFVEPSKSHAKYEEVKPTSKTYEGRVLAEWGLGEDETCQAVLNGGVLMKYKDVRDTLGVTVVCGFKNQEIDKLENTDISVSSIFTIRPGPIEISTRSSQQMAKALSDRMDRANKQAKDLRQEYAHLKTSVWFEVILLPKTVNPLDIHKLADVPRLGGQIPSLGIPKPISPTS